MAPKNPTPPSGRTYSGDRYSKKAGGRMVDGTNAGRAHTPDPQVASQAKGARR